MGVGLERISAGTILAAAWVAGRDCTVGGAGTSASPNPACRTAARGGDALELPVAMPLPNPVLATTPRAPLAPPVPLPDPGPVGMSNPPACAMFTARVCVVLAGMPLGSPKPPVCTCCG